MELIKTKSENKLTAQRGGNAKDQTAINYSLICDW